MQRDVSRLATVFAGWTIFCVFCVLPVAAVVAAITTSPTAASLLRQLLTTERQQRLLTTTITLAVATTGVATALGMMLGIALARCAVARVWWVRLLLTIPLLLPPYILALAAILLSAPASYGIVGATLVMSLWLYPLPMLATEAAVRRVESRLEDAARLVATPLRVWTHITIPLIAPSVVAAALIVFVLAISEFGVPGVLRVRVYTTEVFTAFAALYDVGRAAVIAVPLMVMATLVAITAVRLAQHPTATGERAVSGRLWRMGHQRIAVFTLLAVGAGMLGPVFAALILESRTGRTPWTAALSSGAMTTSLLWSAASASIAVTIAFVIGYAAARANRRRRAIAEIGLVTLFAFPPTLLGAGLVAVWNRSGWTGGVYHNSSMLLVAYLARFLPLAALLCAAFVRRVPTSLEDAAAVFGASWWRSLWSIVIPLVGRGLAGVWLIVFILAFGELGVTVFVIAPGESTMTVQLFTLIANSPSADVARLALTQTAVIVILSAMVAAVWRTGQVRR